MISQRQKKEFPPETFIPKPARIAVIIQLCLAFTVLLGSLSYPFMGELFYIKSKKLLYHTVMGLPPSTPLSDEAYMSYLQRNAERFKALPFIEKDKIAQQYEQLQERSKTSFIEKLWRSFHILFFEIPAFEQLWLFLSIVLGVLTLLRIEGAAVALWLLPVVAALYGFQNQQNGVDNTRPDAALFPSEEVLVQHYLKEPLSPHLLEQERQLKQGWKLFLIQKWARSSPSSDPATFNLQAEVGEYTFDLARLEAVANYKNGDLTPFQKKEPLLLLIIYVAWNAFLAWKVNKHLKVVTN